MIKNKCTIKKDIIGARSREVAIFFNRIAKLSLPLSIIAYESHALKDDRLLLKTSTVATSRGISTTSTVSR